MSKSDGRSVSRRQFLAGAGAIGATAVTPTVGLATRTQPAALRRVEADVSRVSPEGRQAIADVDREFKKQQPKMQKTVDAVENLGLDPTGKKSVSGKLSSALSGMSNTRIAFPSDGVFKLPEKSVVQPDGPIQVAGNGCTFKISPHTETKSFVFEVPGGSSVRDITIDQSAKGTLQEFSVQSTEGKVRADNITIKGYAPAKTDAENNESIDAMLSPFAQTENGVVQIRNFVAVGGTAAGTHDNRNELPPDSPENTLASAMGVWVGARNKGTVQLINPTISGWSNGLYGGRTPGIVGVRGGKLVNNFNSQTRIGGGSVVDGASMLLDDRKWSDKGPFKIGHQGVYAVRVDAKHGNLTDPVKFKNLKIVAKSMRGGASLFDWESKSGPGIIRNCHITNHLNRPVIIGESPSAPAATNILVDSCLIDGSSSASVMEIHDRPQSKIQQTCIKLPDAGPDDIQGAQIGNGVGFGTCKSGSGLSKPKKVGSGGNLSSLPAPTNGSYNGPGSSASGQQKQQRQKKRKGIITTMVTTVLLIFGLIAAGAIGAAGVVAKVLSDS